MIIEDKENLKKKKNRRKTQEINLTEFCHTQNQKIQNIKNIKTKREKQEDCLCLENNEGLDLTRLTC